MNAIRFLHYACVALFVPLLCGSTRAQTNVHAATVQVLQAAHATKESPLIIFFADMRDCGPCIMRILEDVQCVRDRWKSAGRELATVVAVNCRRGVEIGIWRKRGLWSGPVVADTAHLASRLGVSAGARVAVVSSHSAILGELGNSELSDKLCDRLDEVLHLDVVGGR
jgi:hypothetical protein